MNENNLYLNTPPTLLPSFVCHADILGYSQLSIESIKNGDGDKFLNQIREALNLAYERVREKSKSFSKQNRFEIKIFTDNIVVGYPVKDFHHSLGEGELGHIFDVFSEFQVGLAMRGFLVRGGIAFGKHYMDDEIVFGDALIEAVKQDSNGGAPKITLAPAVVKIVQYHLGFYSDPEHAPQSYDLLQDADGSIFVNYLQNAFVAFPDGGVFFDIFDKHKQTLVAGLKKYSGNPSIRSKYEWASRYHNSVIDNFLQNNPMPSSPDADELYAAAVEEAQGLLDFKINIESLTIDPSKIKLKPIRPSA